MEDGVFMTVDDGDKLENDHNHLKENSREVWLAWYHNGFTDDYPVLLDICATKEIADSVVACHKKNRNKEYEYRDRRASWVVEKWDVKVE